MGRERWPIVIRNSGARGVPETVLPGDLGPGRVGGSALPIGTYFGTRFSSRHPRELVEVGMGWSRGVGRRKPLDGRRVVRDEPRQGEDREERDRPEEGDAREKKTGGVISIIQQNAVIINGRSETRQERKEEWI